MVRITPQIGLPVHMNIPKAGQTLTITGQIGVPVGICGPAKFTATADVHEVVKESRSVFMEGSA